jgi:hypothetical protein
LRASGIQVQQFLDVGEGEAELLVALDEPQHLQGRPGIVAVPARGTGWLFDQAAAFVVPQRLEVHSGLVGQLATARDPILNPVGSYGVKTSPQGPVARPV